MNGPISKNQVISSLIWKFIERGGNQAVSFIVSIILARLLSPEDYGLIALITVFITFANIFIESGFSTSLIQKKNVKDIDYSTALTFSLLIAGILYMILYFSAPVIAKFYDKNEIVLILRVISITLFIGSLNSVQVAVISRNMQFKKLFHSSTIAVFISGGVGILLAYNGYGVWALVSQQIVNQLLVTVFLFVAIEWKPKLKFSINSFKALFNYGSNILLTNFLGTLFLNIRNLIIGKIYNPSVLGFYNRGMQFPVAFVSNINGSIQSVMLPTYASNQDNPSIIRNMVRRSIKMSSFIVFPMMVGLAAISESLVLLLLTDKWLPAVIFIQIYCAIYAIMPMHTTNLQAIKALGHSGVILRLEIIKKIIDVIVLSISIPFGIFAIAMGELITSLISTLINAYPNRKYLNYSAKEQWLDILPSLLLSLFMGFIISLVKFLDISNNVVVIIVQISIGILTYAFFAYILKIEEFTYLMTTIKNLIKSVAQKKK